MRLVCPPGASDKPAPPTKTTGLFAWTGPYHSVPSLSPHVPIHLDLTAAGYDFHP